MSLRLKAFVPYKSCVVKIVRGKIGIVDFTEK